MGTKTAPGEFDCYARAAPDEPIFVLLGRDPHAAQLVRLWADLRAASIEKFQSPRADLPKCAEAIRCAAHMDGYRRSREKRAGGIE